MARETPAARIERLLKAGDNAGALRAADEMLRQSPNSFLARLARARANMQLSNNIEAEADIDLALQLSPNDEGARILRATMDLRLGRIDKAVDMLRPIARGRGANAVEARINLLETLFHAGRYDEMKEEVAAEGAWRNDARAGLMLARATALRDPAAGIVELAALFRSKLPLPLRQYAGFEAVTLLDKAGRYREAFDLATELHRSGGDESGIDEWIAALEQQVALLESRPETFRPRADPVQGVAFIVAMPRSGTTLLEQMLDRHPAIGGIGEYEGLDELSGELFRSGLWPRTPAGIPSARFAELQALYLAGARRIRKDGATWTLDKSLRSWRALPEIACIFPGAFCISVDRDPRDVATSLFLSFFNARIYGWTRDFDSIRRVIEFQRRIVPRALEALGIRHERFLYEDLVEAPAQYASRCLAGMGLAMDERVLSPERNTKGAFTLSNAQVRQPINKKSIARWRNYEWAFGSAWDSVVAAHDSRRVHR